MRIRAYLWLITLISHQIKVTEQTVTRAGLLNGKAVASTRRMNCLGAVLKEEGARPSVANTGRHPGGAGLWARVGGLEGDVGLLAQVRPLFTT
jgi:hypothetical protein